MLTVPGLLSCRGAVRCRKIRHGLLALVIVIIVPLLYNNEASMPLFFGEYQNCEEQIAQLENSYYFDNETFFHSSSEYSVLRMPRVDMPQSNSQTLSEKTTSRVTKLSPSQKEKAAVPFRHRDSDSINPKPVWTRITDDLFVYSSYWEDRQAIPEAPFGRTLGLLRYREEMAVKKHNFWITEEMLPGAAKASCHLWRSLDNTAVQGKLSIFVYEEGRKEFVGVFLLCHPERHVVNVTGSQYNISEKESLSKSQYYAVSYTPLNVTDYPVKLSYFEILNQSSELRKNNTAVCVRALYGPFNDTSRLIQFVIYYHAVLKVHSFYFYDLAVSPAVRKVLKTLHSEGLAVELLPWNVPTGGWSELWDFGALTATNDCVYRSRGRHSLVLIVDLDEFVVPRGSSVTGLQRVYRNVLLQKSGNHGDAVLLPNVFFCRENEENLRPKERLVTSSITYHIKLPIFQLIVRQAQAWPATVRSKLLVTPASVVSVGHHMVHHFVNISYKNLGASIHQVALNHYRSCRGLRVGDDGFGEDVLKQPTVRDVTILQHRDSFLANRLFTTFKHWLSK